MYQELVSKLELAISDLIEQKRDQILSDLRNAQMDSQYRVVSFDIYSDDTDEDGLGWFQLSFGTRSDQDKYLNTVADWKYFNISNSYDSKTGNMLVALKAISTYLNGSEALDDMEAEAEFASVDSHKFTVLLFAAAQALLSPTVWRTYNQLQLAVYTEAREGIDSGNGLNDYHIKNKFALNSLIEDASGNKPILHCLVTDGDLSSEANYCEMLKAIQRLGNDSERVIPSIKRLSF